MTKKIKYLVEKNIKKNFHKIFFFLMYLSLIFGFFLNENSSGGAKKDFFATFFLIETFSDNYLNGIKFLINSNIPHSFFHYFIIGSIYKYLENTEILRFFFLNLCILIPIFFYKSLKIILVKKKNALLLSSLIFLSPYFRSSAIWPTTDNTALLFFILSIFFFLKIEKSNRYFYTFLVIFFLGLASMARSYYLIFIICFLFSLKKEILSLKYIIINCIYSIIIFIPNFLHYIFTKKILYNFLTDNIFNNLYINLSIIFFYLIPFIICSEKDIIKFYKFTKKNNLKISTFFLILFLLFTNFNYFNSSYGGGIFFQIIRSYLPHYLFFLVSFLGLLSIYYFINNKIENYFLILFFFISFNYLHIYQKYFDPLFLITIFTISKSHIINSLLNENFTKKFIFIYLYFSLFLIISLLKNSNIN